jgi:hypothetical protein
MALEELAPCGRTRHAAYFCRRPVRRAREVPAASSSSAARWNAERRLGALVAFSASAAEAVAAAAGREVVERRPSRLRPRNHSNARRARTPCSGSPVIANATSSASTRADASSGCSSPPPGAGSSAVAAVVARQAQEVLGEAAFVAEPAQRLEPELDQVVAAERVGSAEDQRLRQAGVVVAQLVLEPAPARPRRRAIGAASCSTQRSSSCRASGSRRSGSSRARPSTA